MTGRHGSDPAPGPGERLSVSVVIPVLDDAAHLRVCLDHLARQTRTPEEVVVVDNGSADDSAAVARRAGARVVPEPAPGIPAAAATGYDAAAGDLILRCDADTRPPQDWVARAAARFEAEPDLAALTGPGTFYDQPRAVGRLRSRAYSAAYRYGAGAALAGTALWGSNLALRAEAWRRVRADVHRHRADVHDDLDLSFHLSLADVGRVVHDPGLHVGAAGRIFSSLPVRLRQMRMAVTTLRLNWALLSPGMRWVRRADRARRTRRAQRARAGRTG